VYRVTASEELKKLVEAGTTKIVLSGELTEEEKKDGDNTVKVLLINEVTSAKELKEEKR
jgi:hypothetical protein